MIAVYTLYSALIALLSRCAHLLITQLANIQHLVSAVTTAGATLPCCSGPPAGCWVLGWRLQSSDRPAVVLVLEGSEKAQREA